jgi:hypothetical protein
MARAARLFRVNTEDAMVRKSVIAIALLIIALGAAGVVDSSFAASIPAYFADEWVGILCVNGPTPLASTKINLIIQMNFDKSVNGGITLAKADQIFEFLRVSYLNFSGASTQTCAIKPSQVNSQFGVNGLQAAQQLTGTYQNYGFQAMVIADSFWTLVDDYLDLPDGTRSLRTDQFIVLGNNNVVYRGSAETIESQVQ